jgi:hypothetical protein
MKASENQRDRAAEMLPGVAHADQPMRPATLSRSSLVAAGDTTQEREATHASRVG